MVLSSVWKSFPGENLKFRAEGTQITISSPVESNGMHRNLLPFIGSTTSTEESSSFSPTSKSQKLRARLREREQRLSEVVQKSAVDKIGIQHQIESVRSTLQQVTDEKSQLEQELEKLRLASDRNLHCDSNQHIRTMQANVGKKSAMIKSLQEEALRRDSALDLLKHELVQKVKRINELELEIESHGIHYTDYMEEKAKFQRDVLQEVNLISDAKVKSTSVSQNAALKVKKLIVKLHDEIKNLSVRYKNERLKNSVSQDELRLKNEELKARICILEQSQRARSFDCEEMSLDDPSLTETSCDYTDSTVEDDALCFLQKQCDFLRAKRTLYREEIARMQKAIEHTRTEASNEKQALERQVERLQLELNVALARVTGSNANDSIARMCEKLSKLESECEVKDRQLSSLKERVADLESNCKHNETIEDRKVSASNNRLHEESIKTRLGKDLASDDTGMAPSPADLQEELQRELAVCRRRMEKKDEETATQRPKNTKKEAKKRGKKNAFRFYSI